MSKGISMQEVLGEDHGQPLVTCPYETFCGKNKCLLGEKDDVVTEEFLYTEKL